MSLRFAVVHEAEADFHIATELADRVLMEAIDWLDEHLIAGQREWVGTVTVDRRLTWKGMPQLARAIGIKAHGHFDGKEAGCLGRPGAWNGIRYSPSRFEDLFRGRQCSIRFQFNDLIGAAKLRVEVFQASALSQKCVGQRRRREAHTTTPPQDVRPFGQFKFHRVKLDFMALSSPPDRPPLTAEKNAEWRGQFRRKERVERARVEKSRLETASSRRTLDPNRHERPRRVVRC
jgi:hypothetical protein